ncbi:MAG: hypothetical protein M1826_004230 [Phylliscum demangeonii]|nr:MAG: hypothetical protein M1826_004230 [Phylliscum demangeonii]
MAPKAGKGEYIETDTGNKVSRRAHILGTPNIILGGKTVIQADCTIRGDLHRTTTTTTTTATAAGPGPADGGGPAAAPTTTTTTTPSVAVSIGRYCFLSPHSVLRPPSKLYRGQWGYYPLKMGDHVLVGEGAVVEAASIGNYVEIGPGAVVGRFAIVKDAVRILPGAVLPPGMVVPAFSVVAGRPARVVAELAEGEWEGLDLRERYRTVSN